MLFPTLSFAVFFALVLPASWLLMPHRIRWRVFMIGASWFFYGAADWRFVPLLAFSTVANHLFARLIHRSEGAARRFWTSAAVVTDLGLLCWFKYVGFLSLTLQSTLRDVGIHAHVPLPEVVLPVGISFFTFQALSYVIDTSRRKIVPSSLLDFAVYLSFFPHLIAGPIVRATEFLPQIKEKVDPRKVDMAKAFWLISLGLFKKVVIASYLGTYAADPLFGFPHQHAGFEALFGVYAYAVQIYMDFSGYTDIAIGLALLLGVRFPQNFNAPYAATSLQDFWRRWHMTLSRWLRDYLYIPLGGNRQGEARTYVNVMITMLLGGLWHGAAWTFVAWGALHGVGLCVERRWRRPGDSGGGKGAAPPADRPAVPEPAAVSAGAAVAVAAARSDTRAPAAPAPASVGLAGGRPALSTLARVQVLRARVSSGKPSAERRGEAVLDAHDEPVGDPDGESTAADGSSGEPPDEQVSDPWLSESPDEEVSDPWLSEPPDEEVSDPWLSEPPDEEVSHPWLSEPPDVEWDPGVGPGTPAATGAGDALEQAGAPSTTAVADPPTPTIPLTRTRRPRPLRPLSSGPSESVVPPPVDVATTHGAPGSAAVGESSDASGYPDPPVTQAGLSGPAASARVAARATAAEGSTSAGPESVTAAVAPSFESPAPPDEPPASPPPTSRRWPPWARRWVMWFITFHVVCLAWIFFRATSFHNAIAVIGRIADVGGRHARFNWKVAAVVVGSIALQLGPRGVGERLQVLLSRSPIWAQAAVLAGFLTVIDLLGPAGVAPFIYFKF